MTDRIVVRGGGDLASGVIHRLFRCGYRILILESELPSAIRRKVAFCEGVNTFLGLKIRIYARGEADGLVLSE